MTTYYRYYDIAGGVFLDEVAVKKNTPAGVRLENGKFILNDAHKKWAYPTTEQARESFLIRKRKQLGHMKRHMEQIEAILARPDPFDNEVVFVAEEEFGLA